MNWFDDKHVASCPSGRVIVLVAWLYATKKNDMFTTGKPQFLKRLNEKRGRGMLSPGKGAYRGAYLEQYEEKVIFES